MSESKLDATQKLEDLSVSLIDGSKIHVGGYHADLIFKMRELPTWKIIDLMQISDADLIGAIEERRKIYCDIALKYFSKQWEFRETGDAYNFEDRDTNQSLFGLHATGQDIKMLLKKKAKRISLAQVAQVINAFRSEKEIKETT